MSQQPLLSPFPNLRERMIPGTLLYVHVFEAESLSALLQQLDAWVVNTGNLIVLPGDVTGQSLLRLSVTYIKAVEDNYDKSPPRKEETKVPARVGVVGGLPAGTGTVKNTRLESDGGGS